jgi:hypothetical protein
MEEAAIIPSRVILPVSKNNLKILKTEILPWRTSNRSLRGGSKDYLEIVVFRKNWKQGP